MEFDTPSTAGASARREHDRRKAKDEAKLRAEWGRFGGIAVALSTERQSTRAWATGARGEELLGGRLDSIASDTIRVLHDRRIPRTRANIDHLVVTPGGVWVVDAKRYVGKRPALLKEGGLFSPRIEKLVVGGRDQTKLVDGVQKQMALVEAVLDGVPVRGALCFIDADWPMIGGAFALGDVEVCWPRHLTKRLTAAIGNLDVDAIAATLADRFVPA